MEDIGRRWRKSSYSGNGGECVEVGQAQDVIAVRDTRQDGTGPMLRFSPTAWRRFADRVKRSLASASEPASAGVCEGALVCGGAPFGLSGWFLAGRRGELSRCRRDRVLVSAVRGTRAPCGGGEGRKGVWPSRLRRSERSGRGRRHG